LAGNRHRPKGEAKMTKEPFEVWEHRVDELLDRKLKPIKRNLRLLKKAYDKQASELLRTQQVLAEFAIDNTYLFLKRELQEQLKSTDKRLRPALEFLLENRATTIQSLFKGNTPLAIERIFHDNCYEYFKENKLPGFKNFKNV
jgi:hypothetical protein